MVAGSPLTAFSVLGPNPGAGVRFFGIGNELEAILTTLTLVGAGAWLETRGPTEPRARPRAGSSASRSSPPPHSRRAASVPTSARRSCSGWAPRPRRCWRCGSSVAGRSRSSPAAGWRRSLALIAVDLVLGGAHLTRSVLGAGDAGDVLDVLDRRVTLMAHTFTHPVYPELLVATVVLLIAAAIKRRQVLGLVRGPVGGAGAGFLGALAGVLVGTVANDSGSVLLVIGTVYLAVFAGFFWASSKGRCSRQPMGTIDPCA